MSHRMPIKSCRQQRLIFAGIAQATEANASAKLCCCGVQMGVGIGFLGQMQKGTDFWSEVRTANATTTIDPLACTHYDATQSLTISVLIIRSNKRACYLEQIVSVGAKGSAAPHFNHALPAPRGFQPQV